MSKELIAQLYIQGILYKNLGHYAGQLCEAITLQDEEKIKYYRVKYREAVAMVEEMQTAINAENPILDRYKN